MANHIQNVELTSIGIKKVLNKYTPQRAISILLPFFRQVS